jgi:hypothetical protein
MVFRRHPGAANNFSYVGSPASVTVAKWRSHRPAGAVSSPNRRCVNDSDPFAQQGDEWRRCLAWLVAEKSLRGGHFG